MISFLIESSSDAVNEDSDKILDKFDLGQIGLFTVIELTAI